MSSKWKQKTKINKTFDYMTLMLDQTNKLKNYQISTKNKGTLMLMNYCVSNGTVLYSAAVVRTEETKS